MGNEITKPLVRSLTFISLVALLGFNVMGETLFEDLNANLEIFVEVILTMLAVYGRWRADSKIDGVIATKE